MKKLLALVMSICMLITFAIPLSVPVGADPAQDDGLVLYLPFDTADGNTSPDTTGGGHGAGRTGFMRVTSNRYR